jgi:hypothetical protein
MTPPLTPQMRWHASALGTLLLNLFVYNYYKNLYLISYIPDLFGL